MSVPHHHAFTEREPAGDVMIIRPARAVGLDDLRDVWSYRELVYFFVWRNVKLRYRQTVLGFSWTIIQPLFTMVLFSLFFGKLAQMPSDGLPYPVFYFSALVPWLYFAGALQNASGAVTNHQHMITKVYFPRVILPLCAVLSGLVDFAVGVVVLLGIVLWYGLVPTVGMLVTLPVFMLLAMLTALGAGLWLSAMNAIYRDVQYGVPFLLQVWMFASPVVYPSSLVPEGWRWVYGLNPMAGVIEGIRWTLGGAGTPPGLVLLGSLAGVLLLAAGGFLYFQKVETTVIDVV